MKFDTLISSIDWNISTEFWNILLFYNITNKHKDIPDFVIGNELYGLNNVHNLNSNNSNNSNSSNVDNVNDIDISKLLRKTFLLRIGYCGNEYYGFQRQGKNDTVRTVEGDLYNALCTTIVSAGRTDRVSKIIYIYIYISIYIFTYTYRYIPIFTYLC
mgnify:CR=1 FL=1